MTAYRFLFSTLRDLSSILGELPIATASLTDELNAPGTATLTMPLQPTRPGKPETITNTILASGKTAIFAERDGIIIWGGILWATNPSLDNDQITLSCAGFHSYLRRRLIRATQIFIGVDQHDIARALVDYAEAQSGGSIGISTTATNLSGVARDVRYLSFERHWIGQAIEQLAALNDGFDFRYDIVRASESDPISVEFRCSYPTTGRRTEHVFELGVNIVGLTAAVDATLLANQADAVGTGEGFNMAIETHTDTAGLAEYPLLEAIVSHADVDDAAALKSYATRRVTEGLAPIIRPSFQVLPDTLPRIGSYQVGDQVRVKAARGLLDINARFRITSTTLQVADTGAETMAITAEPLEVFVS